METKNKYIGALWLQKSKKGLRYLSGNIEIDGKKIKIAVFKNTQKTKDTYPDYSIIESKPRDNFKDDIPWG